MMPAGLLLAVMQASPPDPLLNSWIRAQPTQNETLRRIAPNVQEVHSDDNFVVVESAGLSLQSLGMLQNRPAEDTQGVRHFVFKIPRQPRPAAEPAPLPPGIEGAFVNGVPIYSPAAGISYAGANLWHVDAIALGDDGTWTATGHPVPGKEAAREAPLLHSLLSQSDRHSPLIGFALDGYPIYGPFGWDSDRKVRRLHSSYRIRPKIDRTNVAGFELTPAQEGPPVDATFPAGIFTEDYEYVRGLGDLDEHNGRFAVTPEFPSGTYAYFLSSTDDGKLAYPYLIGPTFRGEYKPIDVSALHTNSVSRQLELLTGDAVLKADRPAQLVFRSPWPFLEKTHERVMHVAIVSEDLKSFAHVHPEQVVGGLYTLTYQFPHGGRFRIFVDHTPPGRAQTVSNFLVTVEGPASPPEPLRVPAVREVTVAGLTVSLAAGGPLVAGRDARFQFHLDGTDLEPYLGAWAHIMVVSQDGRDFIHAHAIEDVQAAPSNPWTHSHAAPGPSPSLIETVTGFNRAGLYKLWFQVQRQGEVLTFAWVVRVSGGPTRAVGAVAIPPNAIRVDISSSGYIPSRITAPAGKPITLAFRRTDAQNCAGKVIFPELKIDRPLPVGQTVLVVLDPQQPRELRFGCGMGMYKGSLIVK